MDIWRPEAFEVAFPYGPATVNGYTYRGLGLFKMMDGSPKGHRPPRWNLSHLGTGHRLAFLDGTVATAFPIATEIAEAGDWEFISLVGYKDRFPDAGERLAEIIARHAKIAHRGGGSTMDKEASHAVAQQIASNRP